MVENRHKFSRHYIFPTRYGWIFFLVLLGMLIGAINHNNNLAFIFTFLLSGMALISLFYTHRNLAGIRIGPVRCDPVFAGDPAHLHMTIHGPRFLRNAIDLSFPKDTVVQTDMAPDHELQIQIPLSLTKRGKHKPPPLSIETRFPVGLFRSWLSVRLAAEIIVYPRPIFSEFPSMNGSASGEGDTEGKIRGVDDFQGLQPYAPGDSPGRISWKAFSRGRGLFTKLFSAGGGYEEIILDWNAFPDPDPEKRLSNLCYCIIAAHDSGLSYGLTIPGLVIEPARSNRHRLSCLKALALYGVEGEFSD